MNMTLDEALQKGIEAHKAGKFQEADRYYTAMLKAQPRHPDANHNMGVLAVGVGKVEQALPFFKTALEVNQSIEQFWLSYIDALIKLDRFDDASSVVAQAREKNIKSEALNTFERQLKSNSQKVQNPSQKQLNSLISLYSEGQFQKAIDQANALSEQFPTAVVPHNICGAAKAALQKFDAAIEHYKQAIKIKPDYADAYNNMGISQQGKGDLEAAIESFNKALEIKHDFTEAYNNLGNTLQKKGDLESAIENYQQAIYLKPEHAETYYNLGVAFKEKDDLGSAIKNYEHAINLNVNYIEAYYSLGVALREKGELDAAIDSYRQVLKLKPDYTEAYNNLAVVQKDKGDSAAAIDSYNKALEFRPNYTESHRGLSLLTKYTMENEHFKQMLYLSESNSLTKDERCNLNFALAKAYEDIGNLKKSFEYYVEGNTLRKQVLGYNIDRDIKLFQSFKKTQPEFFEENLSLTDENEDLTAIFILGMPRSGTTLVEQIISCHSEITGAGELPYIAKLGAKFVTGKAQITENNILDFRDKYLIELRKKSQGKKLVTDKMPQNFRFIPLICAAFPNATIIHVERDPAATCWSNFKTYFATKDLGYSYNLDDLTKYFKMYKELMVLWEKQYPNSIYKCNYELLTGNQEYETKKLLKAIGLGWENACLSPHENKRHVKTASKDQIRQAVYKGSSQQWKKYKPYLGDSFKF